MRTDIFVMLKGIMKCMCRSTRAGRKISYKPKCNISLLGRYNPILLLALLLCHSVEENKKQRMKCWKPCNRGSTDLSYLKIQRGGKKRVKICFLEAWDGKWECREKNEMKQELFSSNITEQVMLAWLTSLLSLQFDLLKWFCYPCEEHCSIWKKQSRV